MLPRNSHKRWQGDTRRSILDISGWFFSNSSGVCLCLNAQHVGCLEKGQLSGFPGCCYLVLGGDDGTVGGSVGGWESAVDGSGSVDSGSVDSGSVSSDDSSGDGGGGGGDDTSGDSGSVSEAVSGADNTDGSGGSGDVSDSGDGGDSGGDTDGPGDGDGLLDGEGPLLNHGGLNDVLDLELNKTLDYSLCFLSTLVDILKGCN